MVLSLSCLFSAWCCAGSLLEFVLLRVGVAQEGPCHPAPGGQAEPPPGDMAAAESSLQSVQPPLGKISPSEMKSDRGCCWVYAVCLSLAALMGQLTRAESRRPPAASWAGHRCPQQAAWMVRWAHAPWSCVLGGQLFARGREGNQAEQVERPF